MKCPFCGFIDSKVVDSRPADDGDSIRRRRECLQCSRRFTTYETVEKIPLMVIKRDGSRQAFDKQKMLRGMIRACYKRPVETEVLERVSGEIEQELRNSMTREVPAERIGELVMERLKELDEVSYVRFASVYRQFKDITTFRDELNRMLSEK
jgi:transcriptional repressor NrdR